MTAQITAQMSEVKLKKQLQKVKKASVELGLSSVQKRNAVLKELIHLLKKNEKSLISANQKDLHSLPPDTTSAFKDRMIINSKKIQQMVDSLIEVIKQPDPLQNHQTRLIKKLKNKLVLKKIKSPLGVILMIFESRPNVAIEAFSMGFKSGNALILKSGKECLLTTELMYKLIHKALLKYNFKKDCLWGVPSTDRELVQNLLKCHQDIDVVIPRGSEKLIEFVSENSKIPLIKNDRGLCHIYVNQDADIKSTIQILINAKTQRPSVCNSMETVLINEKIAAKILPSLYDQMKTYSLNWKACKNTKKILGALRSKNVLLATEKSWDTEYLDFTMNCKIVKNTDKAIEHIRKYSSHHSESILTKSKKDFEKFKMQLDSAVIYWNASTRFTDGFEFGMGGEIGISTQKLHVRGPVGLEALTTERWIVEGQGQVRG